MKKLELRKTFFEINTKHYFSTFKDDPPNTEAFLQISTRAIGTPKKVSSHVFFSDKATLLRSFKTHSNVWHFLSKFTLN